MIRNNKHKDLACMYKLLIRVDSGLKTICSTISAYLRELGKGLVAEDEGTTAISYIQVNLTDKVFKVESSGSFTHSVMLYCCITVRSGDMDTFQPRQYLNILLSRVELNPIST